MYIHNIDPVLLRLGIFEIRWYGLIYALGFVLALTFLLRLSRKKAISLSEDDVYLLISYLIAGVVVGARAFEVIFYHPFYYFSNPLEIFAVWNGGLSFHGGLAGAALALWIFAGRRAVKGKVSFLQLADAIVVPASLALALGRIGNFINGEIFGKITNVPWAVKFPGAEGFRHPSQLYESMHQFLLYFFLSRQYWKKAHANASKKKQEGHIFWLFVLFYGAGRFILEFWKEPEAYFLWMPTGMALSLIMAIVAGTVLIRKYWK